MKNNQPSLFGTGDPEETVESAEVSFFCVTCGKGSMLRESPPIMTPAQRRANGFIEVAPGKWHKKLDACSRQCEIKMAKSRENEEK